MHARDEVISPWHGLNRALALLSFAAAISALASPVERPPQFVQIAFDNCDDNARWEELLRFQREMKWQGKSVRFTFFLSAAGLVTESHRNLYAGPGKRPGQSDIGFGGEAEDILERVRNINLAYSMGDEIGSHAVGHFDGSHWSREDWTREFEDFNRILFNLSRLNDFPPEREEDAKFEFNEEDIQGFRAPYLDVSAGLYETLNQRGFRYDTSQDGDADLWPSQGSSHLWEFPLADLRIAGTGLKTLSMDYNFFMAQSHAKEDPANAERYGKQMLETYLEYFKASYTGNRAPIHIGHHFANYQSGAYRRALLEFAREVCGLPEVRCVSYRELADFMDRLDPKTREAYQRGRFPKMALLPPSALRPTTPGLDLRLGILQTSPWEAAAEVSGADQWAATGARLSWSVDGAPVSLNPRFTAEELPRGKAPDSREISVALVNDRGAELARSTHRFRLGRGSSLVLDPEDLEGRNLRPDPPEAHFSSRFVPGLKDAELGAQ